MDKEIEIVKIQVFADYCHSRFTSYASFISGLTIAWSIAFITLLFQRVIDITFYFFVVFIGFVFLVVFLFLAFIDYHKNLDKIDKLIQQVNKGEPLSPLRELRKKRFGENKT